MTQHIVQIGEKQIILANPVDPEEVRKLSNAYLRKEMIPVVVIAAYKGRYLAVNGSHRLAAMELLLQSGKSHASVLEPLFIRIIDGDEMAKDDKRARDALDWLESNNLAPTIGFSLEQAERAFQYQKVCAILAELSAEDDVKASLLE